MQYTNRIHHLSYDTFCKKNGIEKCANILLKHTKTINFGLSMNWNSEQKIICNLAKSIDAKKIFEIGTSTGTTCNNLAFLLPNSLIYTLDKIDYTDSIEYSNIISFIGNSLHLDFRHFYNTINLFYIDGSHTYTNVKHDGIIALNCIKKDGFIVFHDFYNNFNYHGLVKAICELSITYDKLIYWIEGTRFCILKG